MKYEEIEIGDVFIYQGCIETVISKIDEYRIIVTIDSDLISSTIRVKDLHYLKPLKEESTPKQKL